MKIQYTLALSLSVLSLLALSPNVASAEDACANLTEKEINEPYVGWCKARNGKSEKSTLRCAEYTTAVLRNRDVRIEAYCASNDDGGFYIQGSGFSSLEVCHRRIERANCAARAYNTRHLK